MIARENILFFSKSFLRIKPFLSLWYFPNPALHALGKGLFYSYTL